MTRPSHNLQAIAAETEDIHDDNWMISYIDVFVLMTTIFVMLLVLTRPDQTEILKNNPLNTSSTSSITGQASSTELSNVTPENTSELIDLSGQEIPQELTQWVANSNQTNTSHAHSNSLSSQQWLDNIKQSIDLNSLNEQVKLQAINDFTSMEIQSRVLFKSGASELSLSGEALLEKLVPVLKSSEGLIFIEGHTDDQPIKSEEFPSNWDLASARATEVLQFFVAEGLSKQRFRAVSYGDTKPLFPNDSALNRQKNRRVSLMIQGPK